jgi:putative membrane protein
MKSTCILILSLVAVACHSDRDSSGDHWTNPTPATTAQTSQAGQKNANGQSDAYGSTTNAAMKEGATKGLSADDNKFVSQAAQGGMFEVKASRLALDKGVPDPTRQFAQMMVDDHGKANRDLESIVKKKGGTVPATLDADHQEQLDGLADLNGKEFERKYHDVQVKGHDEAIALFERYSKNADDPDIKAFANRLLPILRAHRKHLDEHPME